MAKPIETRESVLVAWLLWLVPIVKEEDGKVSRKEMGNTAVGFGYSGVSGED